MNMNMNDKVQIIKKHFPGLFDRTFGKFLFCDCIDISKLTFDRYLSFKDNLIMNYNSFEDDKSCCTIIWTPIWRRTKKGELIEFGYGCVNPETKVNHYWFYNEEKKEEKGGKGLAIAAVVFSLLIPIIGLILGGVALNKSKETGEGKGLAIAAIVISVVTFILNIATNL